jgi:hypothetical protein
MDGSLAKDDKVSSALCDNLRKYTRALLEKHVEALRNDRNNGIKIDDCVHDPCVAALIHSVEEEIVNDTLHEREQLELNDSMAESSAYDTKYVMAYFLVEGFLMVNNGMAGLAHIKPSVFYNDETIYDEAMRMTLQNQITRFTRQTAARKISRFWMHVTSDPSYLMCRKRLLREFQTLQECWNDG